MGAPPSAVKSVPAAAMCERGKRGQLQWRLHILLPSQCCYQLFEAVQLCTHYFKAAAVPLEAAPCFVVSVPAAGNDAGTSAVHVSFVNGDAEVGVKGYTSATMMSSAPADSTSL